MKTKLLIALSFILLMNFTSNAQSVFSGEFESESFFATFEGDWEIIKTDSGFKVIFKDNFDSKKAPDLKIFLSKLDFDDINAKNAANRDTSTLIAPLKKYEGAMEFAFPSGVDPNDCLLYTSPSPRD